MYSRWCHVCRILFTVIWQNAWITLETFTRCLTQLFRFLWYILVYVSNRLLTNLIISCLSEFDWFNSFQCLCKFFFFQMKWHKFDYHWVTLCLIFICCSYLFIQLQRNDQSCVIQFLQTAIISSEVWPTRDITLNVVAQGGYIETKNVATAALKWSVKIAKDLRSSCKDSSDSAYSNKKNYSKIPLEDPISCFLKDWDIVLKNVYKCI